MNFKKIKRCLSAAAASALLFTSIPAVNISAAGKVVLNCTFDSGVDGWNSFKQSGGEYTMRNENQKLAVNITNVGTLNYSVQAYYGIVRLYKNGVYRIKYDISSTVDRKVEVMLQQNGGDYASYTWKGVNLTSQPQTVDYQFTMTYDTDIMAKLAVNCGYEGVDLPPHTIYLDNVYIELVDDSGVDYSETKTPEIPIITNQVGYKTDGNKIAVFRNAGNNRSFSVVNAASKQTVYTGELYGEKKYNPADETLWYGDFSQVTAPGKYYITCGNLEDSYTFEIADNVYSELEKGIVKMLYLQRCGTAISDTELTHPACHTGKAKVYGTNEFIDVNGGWHDAGDYGRYVVPGAKTVADILLAYGNNPDLFGGDDYGIPESGNGIPDILDEARYELEWMLKMQDSSTGGVHHKVTCANFPGYVMPQYETDTLIVTPVTTTATGDFCASMAMAYQYYKGIDDSFANTCMNAAKKAWGFLQQNPNFIYKNPEDITTGDYGDTSDRDERYWASAQMYAATGDESYLEYFNSGASTSNLGWAAMDGYGNIAIVTMDGIDKNSAAYTKAKSSIVSRANTYKRNSENGYGAALSTFYWGSNMDVADAGIILGLAYQLTGDDSYLDAAAMQADYLLGKNPLGMSFVTGYGTKSPEHPHHRPSMANNKAVKGMLVGGVNSGKEDDAAKAYLADTPAAKCYIDNEESYSTNEICIYWNSPLIYLMSLVDNAAEFTGSSDIIGDVDLDGDIDADDVKVLEKYLVKLINFNSNQMKNADLNKDSIVNIYDLCLLKRKVLGASARPDPVNPPIETTTTIVYVPIETVTTTVADPVVPTGEPDPSASMIADFRQGASQYFEASNGWTNGNPFNCTWYASNASLNDGLLKLTIDRDTQGGNLPYSAAEYRTKDFYSYGYYETSMKAIKNNGVVSSFFTYTGPSDNNPWDEIDIEVLGKDTTKVQFNYYTNGVGNHEYMYDLGFDASEGFHTYGFDWQPDHITWYIDGKAVYTATSNIPSTAGKIMMNVWPGTGVDNWLNPFDGRTPLTAEYKWVTYK